MKSRSHSVNTAFQLIGGAYLGVFFATISTPDFLTVDGQDIAFNGKLLIDFLLSLLVPAFLLLSLINLINADSCRDDATRIRKCAINANLCLVATILLSIVLAASIESVQWSTVTQSLILCVLFFVWQVLMAATD